jgi:hypothetical protein
MTRAVKSGSETKTFNTVVRVAALVAWMCVGIFISRVLGDLSRASEEPMPYNPAILTLSMFVLSSIALAAYWFGKPFDRVIDLPTASTLKRQLMEATRDDSSMANLHSEALH